MKKIVFVNQYFYPIMNPPGKRMLAFAKYFSKNKWDVEIITGMPNYPKGKLIKKYKGKIYYKEHKGKIKINRYYEIPLALKGFIKPLLNYTSFAVSSMFSWNKIRKTDIVYISSPPIFSSISIFIISKLFKKKMILEIRDLYPETAEELGLIKRKSLSYKLFKKINKWMFTKAQKIITINDLLAKKIEKKYDIKKVEVITNFAKKKEIVKQQNKKIKIAYTGVITEAQDLKNVLKENSKFKKNIEFHIVGDGNQFSELKKIVKNEKNIFLYGYKNKTFCDKIIRESDICLLTLKQVKLFEAALPSKIFEYLSFGKPVLANTSLVVKDIIEDNDCGWYFNNKNIVKKINALNKQDIKKKSKKALKLFNEKFEEEKVCKQIYDLVKKVEV